MATSSPTDESKSEITGFDVVKATAAEKSLDISDEELAAVLDAADPLQEYRGQFLFPPTDDTAVIRKGEPNSVYLCGNSLGLQPTRAKSYIVEELDKWSRYGVEGHFRTERPWVSIDETVEDQTARLLGAKDASEVVVMNTLTTNLHLLMVSFYRPTATRYKILVEGKAFPSDAYACQSQVKFHGHEPKDAIIEVMPREGERLLHTEDILAAIEEHGDEVALVLFAAVQYYSGQHFDMEAITRAGKAKGCIVGIDLAHATGNVPLKMHDWGVDFAAFCSYKYLNSGPGGIAGIFVHENHHDSDLPRFAGWWGHRKSDRFVMDHEFHPTKGASGWQLSNPGVWQVASLRASLDMFHEVGMDALRSKSLKLTGYLEALINAELSDTVSILTPADPEQRGAQLSLVLTINVKKVYELLQRESVIVDIREPYAMRVAPAPFYNSFADVRSFVTVLKAVIAEIKADAEYAE